METKKQTSTKNVKNSSLKRKLIFLKTQKNILK